MGMQHLETLQHRVRAWQGAETGWHLYYTLFSRSGFTQPLRTRADDDSDLLLFGPGDVV